MAKGNFIDYITSDDPNKYPSDGVHTDGYYYKKVTKSTGSTTPTEPEPTLPDIFIVTKDIPEITDANIYPSNDAYSDITQNPYFIRSEVSILPITVNGKTYSTFDELDAAFRNVYISTEDSAVSTNPLGGSYILVRRSVSQDSIYVYCIALFENNSATTTIPTFTVVITCVE